ncbi:MAG: pantetheine-phosphate adenylyltransferase [Clostridia bacterium]
MKICIYPGSFDPVTNGHYDIIKRSAQLFDKVIVAVGQNSSKKTVFSTEERVQFIKKVTEHLPNVEVESFSGLLVDFVKEKRANVIVKGLRAVSDFEYEFQMASMNHKLAPNIETIFMMTSIKYSYLSSSIVREVGRLGGCIQSLVPEVILEDIQEKLRP